jgi:hypothetical protein
VGCLRDWGVAWLPAVSDFVLLTLVQGRRPPSRWIPPCCEAKALRRSPLAVHVDQDSRGVVWHWAGLGLRTGALVPEYACGTLGPASGNSASDRMLPRREPAPCIHPQSTTGNRPRAGGGAVISVRFLRLDGRAIEPPDPTCYSGKPCLQRRMCGAGPEVRPGLTGVETEGSGGPFHNHAEVLLHWRLRPEQLSVWRHRGFKGGTVMGKRHSRRNAPRGCMSHHAGCVPPGHGLAGFGGEGE